MEYLKGKREMINMITASTILKIDELPTKDIHYHEHFTGQGDKSLKSNHSKGSFDYLKTMLFGITYRPTDGLSNQEIKRITDFVLNSDKILYYSMGVEVKGGEIKTQHLHIHVVMKVMCRYGVIDKMFEPLMKGERVAPRPDIALKVTTCKRNEVQNKTVLLHSVYPLKDAAIDKAAHEITSEHWNNRITTWTNIFDGKKDCMGDELDWWKWKEDRFKHLLFKKFHTDHKETITITSGNALKMIKEYASKKNIPFSLNQRAAIIAEMVTDTTDTVNYEETLIKGKAKTAINSIKEEENYKPKLLKMLQDHYDECDRLLDCSEQTTSGVSTKQGKMLARENAKWQKKCTKLKNICKGHVVTIRNFKRKQRGLSALQDQTKTSTYMICTSPQDGDLCCVCKKDTGININGFEDNYIEIRPCNHKYCRACIETQLDKNTINCDHCNINAIEDGIGLKEHWCPEFKAQMEFHRGMEHARWRDGPAAKRQKTENSCK